MGKSNVKLMIVIAILQGLLFASIMALFGYIVGEKFNSKLFAFHAIFFGFFMGIVFPLFVEFITRKILKKNIINLDEDEDPQYESAATLKSKSFSSGGKLLLTNKRLAFNPHKLNSKNVFIEIPLNEITKIASKSTLLLIHNILIIITKNEEYKFYVTENERDVWIRKISDSLKQTKN